MPLYLALAVGACCPVCGSADHPHRASPAPDAPDALAEKAALKELDDAKSTEHVHDELVRDLTTRLAVARGGAGDVPARVLREELTRVRSDLDLLRAVADRTDALEERLEKADADRERLAEAVASVELEARTLDAAVDLGGQRHGGHAVQAHQAGHPPLTYGHPFAP